MRDLLPRTCPGCGKVVDCHDGICDPSAVPSPGDVTLCGHCGQLGIYTENAIRLPTPEELAEITADQRIRDAMTALVASELAGTDIHAAVDAARQMTARRN